MTSRPSAPTRTSVNVTVRYWASARAVAGCDSERFGGHVGSVNVGSVSVGDVLAEAAAAHTGLSAVLDVSTILLDGRAVTAAEPLTEGVILEVLPPFAGG
jgi:molybdopterin converting factor small subunit